MNITHDKQTDMAYIQIEPGKYNISKELPGGIVVDLSKSGKILGFEIYEASKRVPHLIKRKVSSEFKFTTI